MKKKISFNGYTDPVIPGAGFRGQPGPAGICLSFGAGYRETGGVYKITLMPELLAKCRRIFPTCGSWIRQEMPWPM